ncbi:hypothetical protein GWI33_014014 [Rhynchophorus ferrugineus]|uniref:ubiquitinyl hydrolase 1 n=1 Tax=Rhynchophorus ferrugineus TaxID=354439 RepID=A0A834M632_RHYFE|nr:hypothetical protein GWI33_014014 [Rhynchophorus ferrugineus]
METIFHEKQDGSLCAQHCLNSLLQGSYFTAVDLGTLANRLDEEEREQMAEGGVDTEQYLQVITSALQVWGLELVPYCSTDTQAKSALENPSGQQAFICNYRDHWFTIRKIGNQWFNLNSLLTRPELISDTYLALFLAQLKNDGYSIFIVSGDLPECTADEVLKNNPVQKKQTTALHTTDLHDSDPDMQAALRLSLQDDDDPVGSLESDDKDLQEALRLSLQDTNLSPEDDDEDSLLKKAISMSLQC